MMWSAGTRAVALLATSGLVAVITAALCFSSILHRRNAHILQLPTPENYSDKTTTELPLVSEEFVIPVKKSPPPVHHLDVQYSENLQINDDHHSGHFRDRVADIWDPHPEYEFEGFGKMFHLQLSHSKATFVLPNLKVAHVWDNLTRLEETPLIPGNCYYSGQVVDDSASNVFVNLCHGMSGLIRTSNGSYIIEPDEEWLDYRTPIRHILRKISNAPKIRPGNCHTQGSGSVPYNYGNSSRAKRSLSQEYYLELMVVADKKMVEKHGKDLNNYILTLMGAASNIFKDASIGNMITLTVVSLIIAKEEDFTGRNSWPDKKKNPNFYSSSASDMLAKFCNWQKNSALRPHDTALLITRENICSNPLHEKCETLGLAEVGRVCHKDFSCAIVKDNGLNTAFTIAHELGHVLNMPHDEDVRCSLYNVDKKSHVMATVLDNNTFPWSWSACSRHVLTEFLHAGSGNCLLNPPQEDILPLRQNADKLPGELYTANKQCELVFGDGWTPCELKTGCRKMWCSREIKEEIKGETKSQRECRTGHMPWADGTPCPYQLNQESEEWCYKGECLPKDRNLFLPVDGEWGAWQEYGPCSRTCGGGVKKAIRLCDAPTPLNGGRYCIGQRVRYLSCNTMDCPPGSGDFREQQCAKFNSVKFKGKGLSENTKWGPKYGVPTEDRCKLYCQILLTSMYYQLEEKVVDGTPCGPGKTYDICVDGICHQAGCDHILDSNTEVDICGVCGGDNSTCTQKRGSYNKTRYGYSYVARIPKGASNLDIRQYASNNPAEDNNYIALVDSESKVYILNGNSMVSSFKKLILYEGTTLEYNGSGNKVERVNSSLPLNKDLIVEVLSVRDVSPPNVVYEYTVQKNSHAYVWEDDSQALYTPCNQECNGERWKTPRCLTVDGEEEVEKELCEDQEIPSPNMLKCNTHCELSWEIVSKSDCSNPCGEGERTLTIKCVKTYRRDGRKTTLNNDETCSHLSRPLDTEVCTGSCDKTGWKYSTWGPCSVTCGDGKMKRTAKCVDSASRERDSSECDETELKLFEVCNLGECPRWEVEQWTPCSVTCGRGFRHRPLYCKVGDRKIKSLCTGPRPISEESCDLGPCPYWKEVGEWSPCSATCGNGVMTIRLDCSVPDGCFNVSKPQHTKGCYIQPCALQSENAVEEDTFPARYSWRQKWSSCSASCGHGRKMKATQCFDNTNDRAVDARYCPPLHGDSFEVNTCYTRCPQWKYDEWEPCSAICEEGFETRKVFCEGENGKILPDSYCSVHTKPINERKCKVTCKNHYDVGPWSECSVTCGIGEQYRNVQCRSGYCYEERPPKVQPCNQGPCSVGEWMFGNWSSCNVTCGHGHKHLEIFCKSRDGLLDDKHCPWPKPKVVNSCFEGPCEKPRWRAEKWSPCSASCGPGKRTRGVHCIRTGGGGVGWRRNKFREHVKDHHCSARKPPTEELCEGMCGMKPKSNDAFTWKPDPWKPCSHPCSKKGKQERTIHCYNSAGNEVPRRFCPKQKKPPNKKKCDEALCPTCRDLYLLKKEEDPQDGEYTLSPKGPTEGTAKIYCSEMSTGRPREYITVNSHNYAMVFHEDIRPPSGAECAEPVYNGQCGSHYIKSHLLSGFTVFYRLAINISTLVVIGDDWTFAEAVRGYHIPVGEAGDCFSRWCPQGSFKVSLKGTSFALSQENRWQIKMPQTHLRIRRSEDRKVIEGRCGGCCGMCQPKDGIKLDLAPP